MDRNNKLTKSDISKAEALTQTRIKQRHECLICKKTFQYYYMLELHMFRHTQEKPYFCKLCPGEFTLLNKLRLHLETHNSDRERKFQCTVCPKRFFTANARKVHTHAHGRVKFDISNTGLPKKARLKDHILTVHPMQKPFCCNFCYKIFTSSTSLNIHLQSHNPNRKREFQCILCPRDEDLKRHIGSHLGEKPYKCEICDTRFTESGFHKHKRVHQEDTMNFSCNGCNNSFRSRYHLKRHYSRQHDPNSRKEFQCELCAKCFYTSTELKRHIVSHTGEKTFKCRICNKSFTTSGELGRHNTVHIDLRPFECEKCNKLLKSKDSLRRHRRGHASEKLFQCGECDISFKTKAYVRDHLRRTHDKVLARTGRQN